ncbi:MAG: MFS transporter [Victivallaceae bacterium]|nr:MFS transporter [Victivallaceae bacterium]
MREKLHFGRYDYAGYFAFIVYAMCSLAIPLVLVSMGKSLNFPLDKGGMAAGGLLHLFRSIALFASLLLCGMIGGRLGKRRTMGIAMLLIGTGVFLCSMSPVYSLLIPFLLVAGFGEGICEGMATPFVQDLHADAPERYVNIAHSMWSVGIFFCVIIAGTLLSIGVSWRIILAICGLLGIPSALLFLWKETPAGKYPESGHRDNPADIWRYSVAIAKNGRFWTFCRGMSLGAGAEFCLPFWAAAYLELTFHASAMVAGSGTAAVAAGMFAGRAGFGFFARKAYLKHILLACSIGTIPFVLLLATLKPELFPSQWVMFATLLAILFICGVGISPFWPTLQVYGVEQLPELDSTMLYIYFSAMGVPGCGFFTWIMGVVGDRFGLRGAYLMMPVTLIAYALIIFAEGWLFPRKAPCPAETTSRS